MSYNFLIVDDSLIVRNMISKTIEMSQVEVNKLFEVTNGKEALEVLDANWIDIVFTDINMPVMGGIELINSMHKSGLLQSIPVIIISTEGSQTRIDELKAKGVRGYIRKPFVPEDIKALVDEILGEKDGQ